MKQNAPQQIKIQCRHDQQQQAVIQRALFNR